MMWWYSLYEGGTLYCSLDIYDCCWHFFFVYYIYRYEDICIVLCLLRKSHHLHPSSSTSKKFASTQLTTTSWLSKNIHTQLTTTQRLSKNCLNSRGLAEILTTIRILFSKHDKKSLIFKRVLPLHKKSFTFFAWLIHQNLVV
jgi:hypothetical protein